MTAGEWLLALWNNAELLVNLNKVVGVLMALVGAALAAPRAAAQHTSFAAKIALQPLQLLGSALRRLGRLLGMKPRPQTIHASGISDHASVSDGLTIEVSRGDWDPAATVEDRINWLRDAYRNVEVGLAEARQSSSIEHQKIRDELEAKVFEIQKNIKDLELFIFSETAKSVQVQAIGLGPIAAGIILSGIPEILASLAFWGWLVLTLAIAVTVAALRESIRNDIWEGKSSP
jgi:hypothetical protein